MKPLKKNTTSASGNAKNNYYGLDEIGLVGVQEKTSPRSDAYYAKKIGLIFSAARKRSQK